MDYTYHVLEEYLKEIIKQQNEDLFQLKENSKSLEKEFFNKIIDRDLSIMDDFISWKKKHFQYLQNENKSSIEINWIE
jgi:hypothetical protein